MFSSSPPFFNEAQTCTVIPPNSFSEAITLVNLRRFKPLDRECAGGIIPLFLFSPICGNHDLYARMERNQRCRCLLRVNIATCFGKLINRIQPSANETAMAQQHLY